MLVIVRFEDGHNRIIWEFLWEQEGDLATADFGPCVTKILITKSLGVCPEILLLRSCTRRKIRSKLRVKGYTISPTTVYRHLKNHVGARAYKRPKKPRITYRAMKNRLSFAQAHQR